MPRLDTSADSASSYASTLALLFAIHPPQPRREIARSLLLQSVRLRLITERGSSRQDDLERLEGFRRGVLPLRIRPAFVFLNILCLLCLAVLGFHPRGQAYVPINDKILHFICFLLATGIFYFIWDVDEPARRVWLWRNMALILTWVVCFAAGGLGSEMVQSLLPYKTFQWGDVLANLMGSGVGLFFSFHAERRYRSRREIERLYEPLDEELYDDEEEDSLREDEINGDGVNVWKADNLHRESNGKRVHFGQDQVADVDDGGTAEWQTPGIAVRKEDLFQITDED